MKILGGNVLEQNLPPIDLGQHILRYIVEILVHAHNFPHLLQGVADFFQTVHFDLLNLKGEHQSKTIFSTVNIYLNKSILAISV